MNFIPGYGYIKPSSNAETQARIDAQNKAEQERINGKPEEKVTSSNMFQDLDASFAKRLAMTRSAREQDRAEAEARAAEKMPEGILGRISEDLNPEYLKLIAAQTGLAQQGGISGTVNQFQSELARNDSDYQKLIDAQTANNPALMAAREKAVREMQNQTTGRLREANAAAGAGGYMRGGEQLNLARQALRDEGLARGNLERDLLIQQQQNRESLIKEAANQRASMLGQFANLQQQNYGIQSELLGAAASGQQALSQEELSRQMYNQELRNQEVYGRLGLEETGVEQGVTERSGTRSELVSEAAQAESARHSQEMERIQEIEANKPAPSGGKSIMCVAMWKLGLIPYHIVELDFQYCARNIDDDTRRGYFGISTWLAEHIMKHGTKCILTKIFAPWTIGWANEMAFRMGIDGLSNWKGRFLCAVGVPACRLIGKVMRWCGHKRVGNDKAKAILETALERKIDC